MYIHTHIYVYVYLGVIFNSHMSFSNHCHAVVKKAYARANLILI